MKADPWQSPDSSEDLELIQKILAGEINLFEKIQKKYHRQLFSLALRMVRTHEDAEDIVLETFLRVFNNLAKYRKEFQFRSWLFKIASNLCIDYLLSRRFQHISIDTPTTSDEEISSMELTDADASAEAEILSIERTKLLNAAIEKPPELYRRVIILRHFDELDYQEIANQIEIPIGTVKAYLFRARRSQLQILKQMNFEY